MFNKNRPITSLKEDFEHMGLLKQSGPPQEATAPLTEDENLETDDLLEEGLDLEGQPLEEGAELTERLKIQRLKRRPASVRAKSRIMRRKKKSKINRKRRMKMRRSTTKRKMKRLKAMKRGRKAGIRKRFSLTTSAERFGNLMESIKSFNFAIPADQLKQEELIKVLESTQGLATELRDKFDVVESLMAEMEMDHLIEEMLAEEAADEAQLDESTELGEGEVAEGCDEDDDYDDEDDDDDDDMEEANLHMGDEMESLREETVQIIDKLNKSVLSPAEAMSALKDMVDYLGGAMKMYMDVATELAPKMMPKEYEQPGDAPKPVPVAVGDKEAKPHIGQAMPPMETVDPVKPSEVGKA